MPSAADIVAIVGVIISLAVAIMSGKKTRAEAHESEANAVNAYSEAAVRMADAAKDCQEKVTEFTERIDALTILVNQREDKIKKLETSVKFLKAQLNKKDRRIDELERLTRDQELEIQGLRNEVAELRENSKK